MHMPEFDANEDPTTLPQQGQEGSVGRARPRDFVVRRARELADGHASAESAAAGRLEAASLTRRRRVERRMCLRYRRASALRSLHGRRRLWTRCHGRPPGSTS